MIKYQFTTQPTSHVIDIDKMARVKQVTIWGDSGAVSVFAAADPHSPFEPVIDRATNSQLVIDGDKKTFTIVDTLITSLKLSASPTGTWYVVINTLG